MANRRCIGKNVRLLWLVCKHFPRITTTFSKVCLIAYINQVNFWHPQKLMTMRVSSQSYFYEKVILFFPSFVAAIWELYLIQHCSINSCLCRIRVIFIFIHSFWILGIHLEQSHFVKYLIKGFCDAGFQLPVHGPPHLQTSIISLRGNVFSNRIPGQPFHQARMPLQSGKNFCAHKNWE